MIADKILRSEISRLKILSANFKIQPRRLQFGYTLILNFIDRRKTWPAKQMRRRAIPRRNAKSRRKFYRFAAEEIPCCKARTCAPPY
ncbi:hypothetical protein [uncultured Campylobacter sp.]|uniref:hypothetical protein n=1 Tax=uncultured Campylobacter sp. TaxID=218934 RepID=UPI0028EFCDD8|nr:hypothetical protein [uncultured Campylobacter sp.]